MYLHFVAQRESAFISVARKFSEAIRQVNPGPLARLQSSQQQAQLGSEIKYTWYFLKKLNWNVGILLQPKTIARLLFLKCVGFSGSNFIGLFYWLSCDFQISKRPGHTHINHRALFSQSFVEHIFSVLSSIIYSATYLLRFSPQAWIPPSTASIPI